MENFMLSDNEVEIVKHNLLEKTQQYLIILHLLLAHEIGLEKLYFQFHNFPCLTENSKFYIIAIIIF